MGAESQITQPAGGRSLDIFVSALGSLSGVTLAGLGGFEIGGKTYSVPRFSFEGPNNGDPIRIGIFGAIHGDEPAGALAAARLLEEVAADPSLAESFLLQVYPICNPTGFEDNTRHNRRGRDLNREFWRGSAEPEIEILEHELRASHF